MRPESVKKMRASLTGKRYPGRKGKAVILLNDGREFRSGVAAGEAFNISKLLVSRCCRDGQERSGLRFAFREAA